MDRNSSSKHSQADRTNMDIKMGKKHDDFDARLRDTKKEAEIAVVEMQTAERLKMNEALKGIKGAPSSRE